MVGDVSWCEIAKIFDGATSDEITVIEAGFVDVCVDKGLLMYEDKYDIRTYKMTENCKCELRMVSAGGKKI